MVGSLIGTTAAAAAAVIALAGHVNGSTPATGTVSPFGGAVPVHLAQIGRIEVDLGDSSRAGLHLVRCAGAAAAGARCFIAR